MFTIHRKPRSRSAGNGVHDQTESAFTLPRNAHDAKPLDAGIIEASPQLNDLEPQLTRNGYDLRSLVEQFDAKPAEIRRLLRGDLDQGRSQELMDEMRAAGLPT
jgi:hypothetical protein